MTKLLPRTVVVGVALWLSIAPPAPSLLAVLADAAPVGSNLVATDVLDAPSGLAASGVGLSAIDLSWAPTPDPYATGHRVYRATAAGGPYALIAELSPRTATSFSDSPGVGTFYYRVRAYVEGWESGNSNTASCTAVLLAFVCS